MTEQNLPEEDEDYEGVSKSELKRESHRLQALAIKLTEMNAEQLAQLPITPELHAALKETKNIKKREALRRHHQFLGRVMRNADHVTIAQKLQDQRDQADRLARLLPVMEQWRDDLIQGDKSKLEDFINQFEQTDRQHFRQLVNKAKTEFEADKKGQAGRKLFLYIKDMMAQQTT